MRHLVWLSLVIAVAAGGCRCRTQDKVEARRAALARAASYLWAQQGADGGWRSATYGLLASGQSLTPFVLVACCW